MQRILSHAVFTLFCCICPAFSVTAASGDADARLTELASAYRIQIHCDADRSADFPRSWQKPAMRMIAAPIHERDIDKMLPALREFLASHPAAVIQKNLEHIYLLGRLRFQERDYGGTHAGKSIYIVWDRSRKNTPDFILERFHSEFSSILRDHYPFPARRWLAVNPEGFSYSGTGFEMLGSGPIYEATEPDQENGFLVKYSMSSMENDFNIMSAWLFSRLSDLDAAGSRHQRIRQKRELAEAFYRSISNQYVFSQSRPVQSPQAR